MVVVIDYRIKQNKFMVLHPEKQNEIFNVLIYIVISAGLGAVFGYALLFVCITLFLYIVYQLKHQFKLHNWLLSRSENPPEAHGYWGEIFNEIHIIEKDKRKNRERLKKVLARFQNAAEALPDGVITLTKDNEIEWVNQTACSMFGIHAEQDLGQKLNNLVRHPEFQKHLTNNVYSKSITLPRPLHSEHQLELHIIPFGSKQKLVLCRDITHIAQLEVMRKRFISNVSHELRSPLTVIKGYVELLSDDKDNNISEYQSKVFHNMSGQVQRMDRLVEDLLTLTKLETESTKTAKEINIATLLIAIRDNAEIFGKEKQQLISLEVDKNLNLLGDNEELVSLFSNLVNNAVRYTPDKGNIKISWFKQGNQAVFRVQDSGPGIESEHISHLTERFYRVDSDRSRATGGTGLGLSIVKHVLDRYDAQLNIESTVGEGSTFICCFPMSRVIST